MTNLYFADRVASLCRAGGTGPLALDEPLPGYRGFVGVVPPDTDFAYALHGTEDRSEWECGIGRLDGEGRLVRIQAHGSNGDAPVDFTGQMKALVLTVNADWLADRQAATTPNIGDIPGLSAALAGKQPLGDYQPAGYYQPAGNYAAEAHGHNIAGVTGLQAALDAKQPAGSYQPAGNYAVATHEHSFVSLTDKPTTLEGYGIIFGEQTHSLATDKLLLNRGGTDVALPATAFLRRGADGHFVAPEGRLGIGTDTPPSRLSVVTQSSTGGGGDWDDSFVVIGPNGNEASGAALGIGYNNSMNNAELVSIEPGVSWRGINMVCGAFIISSGYGAERVRIDHDGHYVPFNDNAQSMGTPAKRLGVVFAGSGSINTSDEREKRDIGAVPDDWLDAWGAVQWSRYKFRDGKRWHIGLVAQRVHKAFKRRGLDAFEIGLLCRDRIGRRTRWGLRYDECFALEAAWTRRELARLRRGLGHAG